MSLFAAALDSSDDDGNDSSLFSHSGRNFTSIIAERQQKQRALAEKKRIKAEEKVKRSAKRKSGDIEDDDDEPQSANKNRPSSRPGTNHKENNEVLNDESEHLIADAADVTQRDGQEHEQEDDLRNEDVVARKQPTLPGPSPVPILIDDDEVLGVTSPPTQRGDEADDYTDDEFAEIARQARLAQRRKQGRTSPAKNNARSMISAEAEGDHNQEHASGPVVEIFITSPIENTNPLRVMFRLKKSLSVLRTTWCQKQGFSPEMTSGVFLTYRLRKIYDTSTCQSLGLYVNDYGEVKLRGSERKEGAEKVHLVAMTEQHFEQAKRENRTTDNPKSMVNEENVQPETVSGPTQTIRLVLKHPNLDPYKLIVKPTTLIAKIVKAYRKQYKIGDDADIRLSFDGEMLDEKAEMQQTEISDEDVIDVHYKRD